MVGVGGGDRDDGSFEDRGGRVEDAPPATDTRYAQGVLVGFILVFAVSSAVYRLVYASGEEQTAALYIGVPAVLAIGLTYLPRGRSAIGMLLKGSMLALLLAGIVLPEGLVCLLFAAPLVALVALLVGATVDALRHFARHAGDGRARVVVALPLLLMSMEGLVGTPFATEDAGAATRVVAMSPEEVRSALAAEPTYGAVPIPWLLRLGFNQPIGAHGGGLAIGDERVIHFTGGNHDDHPLRLFGVTGTRSVEHHSLERLRVTATDDRRVEFAVVEDTTMTVRWAALERSIVTWEPVDGTHTRVTWRLEYRRLLHPAFYFAPLQRAAASQASGYLLDSLLVPTGPK
jgi:hypothetical protein